MSEEYPGHWPLTHEEIEAWCRKVSWTFASTLSTNPHFYTLKRNGDPRMFEMVVLHIREHGFEQKWWGRQYTQYEADGHHMWTMGDALETTILINRKTNEQFQKDMESGKGGGKPKTDKQERLL